MGDTPAESEVKIPMVPRYVVADPFGASFRPIFPDARVTPAVENPMMIWMSIRRGMVIR